jgi:predicted DNA-binding transcriptional regulator AlpA
MQKHPQRSPEGSRVKLTPEAAHYIGASETFLEKARCAGDGPPFIRIGARKVGYLVEDLDKWLASRRRTSTSDLQGRAGR